MMVNNKLFFIRSSKKNPEGPNLKSEKEVTLTTG